MVIRNLVLKVYVWPLVMLPVTINLKILVEMLVNVFIKIALLVQKVLKQMEHVLILDLFVMELVIFQTTTILIATTTINAKKWTLQLALLLTPITFTSKPMEHVLPNAKITFSEMILPRNALTKNVKTHPNGLTLMVPAQALTVTAKLTQRKTLPMTRNALKILAQPINTLRLMVPVLLMPLLVETISEEK
jgi:hypothetical protein